jgi:hypothetical protein
VGFDTVENLPRSASPLPSASTVRGNVVLPDTEGSAFLGPLLAAAAVVLSAGGLLALRLWR